MCVGGVFLRVILLFSSKQNFHCESPLKMKKISKIEYKTWEKRFATTAKSSTEKSV